jgi:toxin ParE1/3/4
MNVLRLSALAEGDIAALLAWTQAEFGELARSRYQALLLAGLRDIAAVPTRPGSITRPELGPCVHSYHLRHSRDRAQGVQGPVRRLRHLVLYRVITPGLIGVGRVLHDGIELERHLPADFCDG